MVPRLSEGCEVFDEITQLADGVSRIEDEQQYMWAIDIVTSRTFCVEMGGGSASGGGERG